MLFDINNYNIYIATLSFFIVFLAIYFLFKAHITSMLDPLFLHIIWMSTFPALMIIFLEKNKISVVYIYLITSFFSYTISLLFFLKIYHSEKNKKIKKSVKYSNKKSKIISYSMFFLFFVSKLSFFSYAIDQSDLSNIFNYRFENIQGRNAIERIISIGIIPFMYFFLFRMIILNTNRRINIFIISIITSINILSGGRSALISLLFSFGFYIFFFRHELNYNIISKINNKAPIFLTIALVLAMVISSFYGDEDTRQSGIKIIINRFFAAHDGIEYYLKYNGFEYLQSGLYPYFLSIFAVYVKQFIMIDYKNIGWQLSELAIGSDLSFAQGANYTFLLQGIILSPMLSPLYAILIAWIVAKMRYLYANNHAKLILYYALSSKAFLIASDAEYFMLNIISIFIFYLLFVYPLIKLRL